VIRFKLGELLKAKGWTAYRLAQEAGLESPHAYQLAKRTTYASYKSATLDALCAVLNCQPGDLLEWTPDESTLPLRRAGRKARKSRSKSDG
jgi:putative transcriptional regulator